MVWSRTMFTIGNFAEGLVISPMTLLHAFVSKGASSDQHKAGAATDCVPEVTVIRGFGFSQAAKPKVIATHMARAVKFLVLLTIGAYREYPTNGQSVGTSLKMRENKGVSFTDLALSATDVARAAILESVPESHLGAFIDAIALESGQDDVATVAHTFACTSDAYPGWYWSVVVVGIDGQDYCTVSEINLLPGEQALVPTEWRPWAQRVQPGDLGVGDLLPTQPDDQRLTAGFTGLDELADDLSALHPQQWELGLGREQILSVTGLQMAVERWFGGEHGPRTAMAKAAPDTCSTCGFLVPLGGSLGQVFGVCANEFGAADGQIVAMSYGCGAHSSVRSVESTPVPVVPLVIDDESDESADASDVPLETVNDSLVEYQDAEVYVNDGEGLRASESVAARVGVDAEAPLDAALNIDEEAPLDSIPTIDEESPLDEPLSDFEASPDVDLAD